MEVKCSHCWAWFISPPSSASKFIRQLDGTLKPICYGCWGDAKRPASISLDEGLAEWTVQETMEA
jgi:hypothetical protein